MTQGFDGVDADGVVVRIEPGGQTDNGGKAITLNTSQTVKEKKTT